MDPELRPRVPFVGWLRQWIRPSYGFIWVVDDDGAPAIVTQSTFETATIAGVTALHDVLDEIIASGFVEKHPGLVIIHDWRSVKAMEGGARSAWNKRSARPGKPLQVVGVSYLAVTSSSMLRMTIQAGALAVQLATGQPPIRVIDDPAVPLALHNIRAPSRARTTPK